MHDYEYTIDCCGKNQAFIPCRRRKGLCEAAEKACGYLDRGGKRRVGKVKPEQKARPGKGNGAYPFKD